MQVFLSLCLDVGFFAQIIGLFHLGSFYHPNAPTEAATGGILNKKVYLKTSKS